MHAEMTAIILQTVFVACSLALLSSARKMDTATERESLIDAAIQEVKIEVTHIQSTKLSRAQLMLKAFKMSSPELQAQGMAAHKFERMVNLAERKILKSQRQATAQSSSMAEALAMELLHKPGSILTGEEIARMYQESDCASVTPPPPDCDDLDVQRHRTADGTCNNLQYPTRGAAGTQMRRLSPGRYDDSISVSRGFLQSQDSPLFHGGPFYPPLPSPRVASVDILEDRPDNDQVHTHILMQWAQFLDHDMDVVPEFASCPEGCEVSPENVGRCYPFRVPEDDIRVSVTRTDSESVGCHGFRRSLPVCPTEGPFTKLRTREHLNAITHWIDGSMVYHHDPEIQANLIRNPNSDLGLLSIGDPDPGATTLTRYLLPDDTTGVTLCPNPLDTCFLAGDLRVNEQSLLTVMHTIWVREHNRIAETISENNPFLNSDDVFEIAREVVIAEIQKITYGDFLPILLGESFITPYTGYDPEVNPNIPNSFAAAAYRFGHSMVQPFFDRLDEDYESIPEGRLSLNSAFFDTSHIRTLGVDSLLRGLLVRSARRADEFVNSVLTNNLFAANDTTPGLDLVSINIQRGRDHGLPPYLIWKQWAKTECGVESDFRNELTEIHLYQVYGSLDNVDLFVGGLAEEPLEGGIVGAVFGCIFAKTFLALREGDRFYYENLLTSEQIAEIEKTSLSRVICDNSDISEIQSNAFLDDQLRVDCGDLPSVDLSAWDAVTPLTGDCYTRVSTFANTRITVVSANIQVRSQVVPANSFFCFATECPANPGDENRMTIFPQRNFLPAQNPGLPSSDSNSRFVYSATLDSDLFVPRNGFYATLADCNSGSDVTVHFSEQGMTQNAGDMYVDPAREADVIDDKQVIDEFLRQSGSEQRRLMEEMLQAMEATSSKKEIEEEAMKEEDGDAQLVSDLEKLLMKIKK